jgi:hypothetical protein
MWSQEQSDMSITLASRPRKLKRISTPGLNGMEYQQQLALCRELEAQNPRFVDYLLKPGTDEMWNLIDGKRTVAEIIDCSLLEFNLDTTPESWLIVFAAWQKSGLIAVGAD